MNCPGVSGSLLKRPKETCARCMRPEVVAGGLPHQSKDLATARIAHQIDAGAVPMVIKVAPLNRCLGEVGIKQRDTLPVTADAGIHNSLTV